MAFANYRIVEGRKFLWDGRVYPDEAVARAVAEQYGKDRFETLRIEEGGAHLIYTRRNASAEG